MTAKQMIAQVLEQLPDDATMDEILYRLYVRERILQGVESARLEGDLSHDEAKARLSKWTGGQGGLPVPSGILIERPSR